MVLSWELATVGVIATGILAIAAVLAGALTWPAGLLAAVFGSVIVILAGFPFLVLLVLFVAASSLATRYAFREKQRQKVQEGRSGERGISNVLAHIVVPMGLVLVATGFPAAIPPATLAFLYACAIAFGAADTFASEFGVLTGHARSILDLRPVTPGTNGGVSVLGELWGFVGAAATAVVGWWAFVAFGAPEPMAALVIAGVIVAGFAACQVDSLVGAVLENPGYIGKGGTNLLGMVSAVLIGLLLLRVGGVPW